MTDRVGSSRFVAKTTHDKTMKGIYQDIKEFDRKKALALLPDKTLIGMKQDIEEILQTRVRHKPYVRATPDGTLKGVVVDIKELRNKRLLKQLPDKTLKGILKDIEELIKL